MRKLSVSGFDLDKTLTTKDTFFPFTYELAKITRKEVSWFFSYTINAILLKGRLISNNLFKDRILMIFKGAEAQDFVNAANRIKHRVRLNEEVRKLMMPDDIIITASPDIIPRVLFPENKVIGLVIDYEKGHDFCYGHRKLTRVLDEGVCSLANFYTDNQDESSMMVISTTFVLV